MPLYVIFPLAILVTLIYFLIMVFAIIKMEPDYFIRGKDSEKNQKKQHYALWLASKVIKNVIGLGLIIVGLVMLVLPGQGLLTILMGLFFVDFPGKRKLERYLITRPAIYQTINNIRAKANKPPIKIK